MCCLESNEKVDVILNATYSLRDSSKSDDSSTKVIKETSAILRISKVCGPWC